MTTGCLFRLWDQLKNEERTPRQLVRAASHLIPVPAEARCEDNAHLWCAYAIPLALSVVRVVSSNLTTADMKEIIVPPRYWWCSLH